MLLFGKSTFGLIEGLGKCIVDFIINFEFGVNSGDDVDK
jgi:hypothetical protein